MSHWTRSNPFRHAAQKALGLFALLLLAIWAERSLTSWPGVLWLARWLLAAAAAQILAHRGSSTGGTSRFVFTTVLVVLAGCCFFGAVVLENIYRVKGLNQAVSVPGGLLFLVGLALRTSAQVTLGGLFHWNIRVVEGHRLVTTGPFRCCRHPSYLGVLLMALASPLIANAYWSFLAFPILLGCVLLRIHYEERVLRESLPEYAEYARRTARLIPGIY